MTKPLQVSEIHAEPIEAPFAGNGVSIKISDLSHSYRSDGDDVETLSNITLNVAPGDFVSLVGQSGCGKSTLLNIISGLMKPTRGRITLSFPGDTPPALSYLTQEDRLLPWRSALRNVELPLELQGVSKGERRDIAEGLLKRVGLEDFKSALPAALSGGMRQRVSIARALSVRPSILLLDEPFGALDAWNKQELHKLFLELLSEYEATTILVTHDIFEAIALSSQIVTLAPRPGRVVARYALGRGAKPRHQNVLHSPKFMSIYNAILSDLGLDSR